MIDYGYGVALDTIDKVRGVMQGWRNDPAIYSVCRQVGLIDVASQEKWFASVTGNGPMARDQMFAIVAYIPVPDRENSVVVETVGVCGLTSIHWIHRSAELSYYTATEYQSKVGPGFGLKVFRTLIRYAFDDLCLNRVFGDSFAPNTIALQNLKELGFTTEGTLRQSYYKRGQYINSVIQSLLRDEYRQYRKDGTHGW